MMSILCTARNDEIAYRIVEALQLIGYPFMGMSMVVHDRNFVGYGPADAPACADSGHAERRCAADILCGALRCIDEIDAVPIPGIGPLIVAGPLLASMSLAAIDSSVGGIAGALIHEGVPQVKARNLESNIRNGCFLIAMEAIDEPEAQHLSGILIKEGAGYVVTSTRPDSRSTLALRPSLIQHSR